MAAFGTGLLFVGRAALTHFAFEVTSHVAWEQESARPLLGFGALAASISASGVVAAVIARRQQRVGVVIVGVALCVAVTSLVVGDARYRQLHDPWSGYHRDLANLPVPPGWRLASQVDGGRGSYPGGDGPSTWDIWVTSSSDQQQACADLAEVMNRWPATSEVRPVNTASALGLACFYSARRHNGYVNGMVATNIATLQRGAGVPPEAAPEPAGTAISVEIYYTP